VARTLTITRSALTNANHRFLRAFRLRVDVTHAVNMPAEIFLYQQNAPDPVTQAIYSTLITVASPVDLADYPVGAPNPDAELPYFRQSFVELDVRSSAEYQEIWNTIRNAIGNLCEALDRLDNYTEVETVTFNSADGPEPISDTLSAVSETLSETF
jgi:hypothetical protein